MKNKLVYATLALFFYVSFSYVTLYASGEPMGNLLVNATHLNGDILRIEITNLDTGIDSDMEVDLRNYSPDSEYISVQAMDTDGNLSNVIQVENPYYTPKSTASSVASVTSSIDGTRPLTPSGNATVTDNATDDDGKEFFTFTTPNENVFYLVVDRQRDSENVYFLNAVTENDLMSIAEKDDKNGASAIPTPEPTATPEPTPVPTPEPAPKKESNGGMMFFIILAVLAVGGAGYYFKIYKPKQEPIVSDDEGEYEDEYSEYDDYSDNSNFVDESLENDYQDEEDTEGNV